MGQKTAQETTQEMVTITKAEYDRLLDNEFWLECLDGAGVDNWEGYEEAQELYSEGQKED